MEPRFNACYPLSVTKFSSRQSTGLKHVTKQTFNGHTADGLAKEQLFNGLGVHHTQGR